MCSIYVIIHIFFLEFNPLQWGFKDTSFLTVGGIVRKTVRVRNTGLCDHHLVCHDTWFTQCVVGHSGRAVAKPVDTFWVSTGLCNVTCLAVCNFMFCSKFYFVIVCVIDLIIHMRYEQSLTRWQWKLSLSDLFHLHTQPQKRHLINVDLP